MRKALLLAIGILCVAAPGWSQVAGRAAVLRSDTISMNGTVFRLYGIEGLEPHQTCFVHGRAWACGTSAIRAFQSLVDPVVTTCTPTGEQDGGATIAICRIGEVDIADTLVREGWAFAQPGVEDYADAEAAARAEGDGIWEGTVLEPWVYRDQIAAIELEYSRRVRANIRAEVEVAALAERPTLDMFPDARREDGTAVTAHEVRVPELPAGFLLSITRPNEVFRWSNVASAYASWRDGAIRLVANDAKVAFWADVADLPRRVVNVIDEAAYYDALTRNAASWIEAGRQPVLIVASAVLPAWLPAWFADAPPEGAVVTHRDDISSPDYVGTIDGVDVFVGVTDNRSLLMPNDMLTAITYGRNANGSFVTMTVNNTVVPNEYVFRYRQDIEWRDDTIIELRYPEDEYI